MNTEQPLVGVTRCSRLDDYVAAVERAGGRVLVVEAGDSADAILGQVDGLLLTGGADVDPALYNRPRHPATKDAERGRDAQEIALARGALGSATPLLGICRGLQVLNVALGGSLVQDIPTERPGALTHQVTSPKDAIAHWVTITRGSLLERILQPDRGSAEMAVNSRHHQAIDGLAPGLVISAAAPDGVIEAVERPEAAFCVGVQWHPENFWRTGEFSPLFDAFLRASGGHSSLG